MSASATLASSSAASSSSHVLLLSPDELIFTHVKPRQTYIRPLTITNTLSVPLEFTLHIGTPSRYSLSTNTLSLSARGSASVDIHLRLLTPLKPRLIAGVVHDGATEGVRDVFHIRSTFFTQRFHALWFTGDVVQKEQRIATTPNSKSNSRRNSTRRSLTNSNSKTASRTNHQPSNDEDAKLASINNHPHSSDEDENETKSVHFQRPLPNPPPAAVTAPMHSYAALLSSIQATARDQDSDRDEAMIEPISNAARNKIANPARHDSDSLTSHHSSNRATTTNEFVKLHPASHHDHPSSTSHHQQQQLESNFHAPASNLSSSNTEFNRPFERVTLADTRRKALLGSLLRPGRGRDVEMLAPTTTSTSDSAIHAASSSSAHSSSHPSSLIDPSPSLHNSYELLSLKQQLHMSHQKLQTKCAELKQSEFAYKQLQTQYEYVMEQVDALRKAALAAPSSFPPSATSKHKQHHSSSSSTDYDNADSLLTLLQSERASMEAQREKVLEVLYEKDRVIQEQADELDRMQHEMEEREEENQRRDKEAEMNERKLLKRIEELERTLVTTSTRRQMR